MNGARFNGCFPLNSLVVVNMNASTKNLRNLRIILNGRLFLSDKGRPKLDLQFFLKPNGSYTVSYDRNRMLLVTAPLIKT